jgi:uncharacterized membrane protein
MSAPEVVAWTQPRKADLRRSSRKLFGDVAGSTDRRNRKGLAGSRRRWKNQRAGRQFHERQVHGNSVWDTGDDAPKLVNLPSPPNDYDLLVDAPAARYTGRQRHVPMTKLLRPFIAGLFVVLPVVLTIALLAWVVNFVYGFVGPGSLFGRGLVAIGIGFVSSQIVAYLIGIGIVLAAIYLLGLMVETSVRQRLGHLIDTLLHRIPLVGNIYDLAKQVVAIVDRKDGDALQSMRPVWCFFGGEGSAAVLALCPLPNPIMIGEEPYTAVLVPSAPVPVGGALIYVPTKWVKPAEIGVEMLTSIYVSMGMTPPPGGALPKA